MEIGQRKQIFVKTNKQLIEFIKFLKFPKIFKHFLGFFSNLQLFFKNFLLSRSIF